MCQHHVPPRDMLLIRRASPFHEATRGKGEGAEPRSSLRFWFHPWGKRKTFAVWVFSYDKSNELFFNSENHFLQNLVSTAWIRPPQHWFQGDKSGFTFYTTSAARAYWCSVSKWRLHEIHRSQAGRNFKLPKLSQLFVCVCCGTVLRSCWCCSTHRKKSTCGVLAGGRWRRLHVGHECFIRFCLLIGFVWFQQSTTSVS